MWSYVLLINGFDTMKIKNEVHKNKLKSIICDAKYLFFLSKNAPLTDYVQKATERILDFIYSLDVDNEVEHGQFIFPPALNSESAKDVFNKVMFKKTGMKLK